MKKFLTVFLCLLAAPSLRAADYILVDNPRDITILNRFKSELSSGDLKKLGVPAAFKVEKLNEASDDELSTWHRVKLGSRSLFIVVDDSGRAVGEDGPAELTILRNCKPAGDTIRTLRPLSLSPSPKGSGKSRKAGSDELLIRRFKYRSRWFCTSVKAGRANGFSTLTPAAAWKKEIPEPDTKKKELSAPLRTRLRAHLDEANRTYRAYFDWFNRQTGDTKFAPAWEYTIGRDGGTCRLEGDQEVLAVLDRSTGLLLKRLKGELLGRQFDVSLKDNVISIRPRGN